MFLDDGWGTNKTFENATSDSHFVHDSLLKAGFVINQEKSQWLPAQRIEWIGILWDSIDFCIRIPSRRINDCISLLESVLGNTVKVTARLLARCAGKIVSMKPVFGNVVRLMTRFMYILIETKTSWERCFMVEPDHPCLQEIKFWLNHIGKYNVRYLSGYTPTETLIHSDASNIAAGAYVVNCKNSVFRSAWSPDEKVKCSTFRELRAINLALHCYGHLLKGKTVKWFSDSQSCVNIVQSGSTKIALHSESLSIFLCCLKMNIDMRIQWIPRELNTIADGISKYTSSDEWEVSNPFFEHMDSLWGPYDIDRFATCKNRKTERYNSLFMDTGSEAVDCFTQDWGSCNNWLVPPICLVTKTIRHILYCNANATLIVPKWPSAAFWPILFAKNSDIMRSVSELLEFKMGQDSFRCDNSSKCAFSSHRFNSSVLAIRFVTI